jgi:flagellar basal-body rod protein FlgB
MDEVSATLISKALDALSLRYQFTAQNIANANSPGYRPIRVTFEESLKAAAAKGEAAIRAVEPKVHYANDAAASAEARLDLELASAAQTAGRYRALIEILGRQMALHRAVVMDGGR